MDPDTTLETFLDACRRWHAVHLNNEYASVKQSLDARLDAYNAIRDLTEWIGNGGFLPNPKEE